MMSRVDKAGYPDWEYLCLRVLDAVLDSSLPRVGTYR